MYLQLQVVGLFGVVGLHAHAHIQEHNQEKDHAHNQNLNMEGHSVKGRKLNRESVRSTG